MSTLAFKKGLTNQKIEQDIYISSNEIKKMMIIAYGMRGDTAHFKELKDYLVNDESPDIRSFAAIAFGYNKDQRSIPYLKKALKDDFNFSLKKLKKEKLKNIKEEILETEKRNYIVREGASGALNNMGIKIRRDGDAFIEVNDHK